MIKFLSPKAAVNLHNVFLFAAVIAGLLSADAKVISTAWPMLLAATSSLVAVVRSTVKLAAGHFLGGSALFVGSVAVGAYYFNDSLSDLVHLKSVSSGVTMMMVVSCGYFIPIIPVFLYKLVLTRESSFDEMQFERDFEQKDSAWFHRYVHIVTRTLIVIIMLFGFCFLMIEGWRKF